MTIFRSNRHPDEGRGPDPTQRVFRWGWIPAFAGMTTVLGACGLPDKPQLPTTEIGAIFRLGNVDRINTGLMTYLERFHGDVEKINSVLLASNFEGPTMQGGCKFWQFDEPDNPEDRTTTRDMAKYTLFVSVTLCGEKLEANSAYRGL